MIIRLDPAESTPPSEQLVAQIAASVDRGDLEPGDRLPTIRALAHDLGIAPGTVARAYAELERDGWVHTQGRRGTVVAHRTTPRPVRAVDAAADDLVAAAARAGLDRAAVLKALDLAYARRT